jgi:hypothetical protein
VQRERLACLIAAFPGAGAQQLLNWAFRFSGHISY